MHKLALLLQYNLSPKLQRIVANNPCNYVNFLGQFHLICLLDKIHVYVFRLWRLSGFLQLETRDQSAISLSSMVAARPVVH